MVCIEINRVRINDRIRASQVNLIDDAGVRIGVKPIHEAIRMANDKGLDLVEMVPTASPPVCKIMDFNKFKFDQEHKSRLEKKKSKVGGMKEIRFRPNISEHDLAFKMNHIRDFLQEKHKVKITIVFAGREMQHRDLGQALFRKIKEGTADLGTLMGDAAFDRNRLVAMILPNKK